jgi:ribose 5-phosphate isomerase B
MAKKPVDLTPQIASRAYDVLMNRTSSEAATRANQVKTGLRPIGRFGKMSLPNKRTQTTQRALPKEERGKMMRIGLAADHGGFELKGQLTATLKAAGYEVADFGAYKLEIGDDYPDFVVPLARAVARGEVDRGLAICGSGVGACVAANKVPGVRAALITDSFSAHQGVEDDDMNVMCLGGRVTGPALSWDLVHIFLSARFKGAERYKRRLAKVAELENREIT